MGRRKIEIEKIDDSNKRIVTFSKRRSGLMSKAAELCKFCRDIIVCLIVFSPAGNAYTYSNSSVGVCNVVEWFLEQQRKDNKQENKNVHRSKNSTQYRNKTSDGSGSSDSFWWDRIDIEELDSLEKLKPARQSLEKLKQNLLARKEELTAASSSPLSSPSSTIEESIIEDRIVEDTTTIITENHPNLDLSLNLRWQFDEKENMPLPSLLKRDCRHLVEPCQSHPLTELTL
ncbi:hypothetical protein MKX01_036348 [Papaver californicum]|nr:hypothetical protein MKX01_036348 [Papaver californicum]